MTGHTTPSDVFVADDFRDNLIIDRHDPIFEAMRGKKITHLRSANSEDAVSWNVFRTLRQITARTWFPALWSEAFPRLPMPVMDDLTIHLWHSASPPVDLLRTGPEHATEVDVIIESPSWVWFIEAKYRSDISTRTTTRPDRDQLLRNIDVGSHYAGARDFYCTLLVTSREQSPEGAKMVDAYADLATPRERLAEHRPDGLANLRGVSLLVWSQLTAILSAAAKQTVREDERGFATRAVSWLQGRGL